MNQKSNTGNETKVSVRTPWGQLLKAKGVEDQFNLLMTEIETLNTKVRALESQKSQDLPGLHFEGNTKSESTISSDQLKKIDDRVTKLESEIIDVREKLAQIREKFAILSQEIMRKMT